MSQQSPIGYSHKSVKDRDSINAEQTSSRSERRFRLVEILNKTDMIDFSMISRVG